ncbi:ARM repeat-containing protein [Nemania sp. NC0429]|nr:ARM repeat-containing protein [Nemania sp. NC0429]
MPDNQRQQQNFPPFAGAGWQSGAIWGSIGGSKSQNHDSARDSDELSPTAPSGSAQLNGLSEAGPWASRGVWGPSTSSPNDVSPPRTKNMLSYNFNESNTNSNLYGLRQSFSQGTAVHNVNASTGPVDAANSSLRYAAAIGGLGGEERLSSGMYGAPSTSQLSPEASGANRRNSADPTFLGVGNTRSGAFSGRRQETNASTITNQLGEPRQYPFSKGVHTKPQGPSVSNISVSLAPEQHRPQALAFSDDATQSSLSDSLTRTLTLEDTTDSLNGYVNNAYTNPAGQPFQPNPSSQPWQHRIANGTGHFGYGIQQDTWTDPPPPSYPKTKRGSLERGSPASGLYRPHMSSPRNLSGIPNPRTDYLPRPLPRNSTAPQDLDRQHQGPQYPMQPPGFYPPYYNSHVPQFSPSYDEYTQVPNFRNHIPAAGYGGHMNYLGAHLRTNRDKDSSQGARSQLLEEFRGLNKSNRRYELKDLYGHIVEFSGDQHGSRFIQEKLASANSEEKEHVFRELEPNALQLMKDVFGNYVIQKFFEHGNQVQKKLLAGQMKGKVCDLSFQMYSCRVVQKALEHVLVEQQHEITEELRPEVVLISKDQNGNHVIQKVIQMFPKVCIPFIMEAFQGQVEHLASDTYACRVVQRMLEFGTDDERRRLMIDLHASTTKLMSDQYGNYVIQHIIGRGRPEDRSIIIRQVIDRALLLSRHKYASNVVEKCIQFGTPHERRSIRAKLTTPGSDGVNPLQLLVKDQFANYVVQKLLDCLEGEEKATLAQEVRTIVPQLKRQGTSRQTTALERLIAACEALPPASVVTKKVNGFVAPAGTAPSTPTLAVEVNSAAPTPPLTTEQNSPQSSSPPSTSISTADEGTDETKTAKISPPGTAPPSPLRLQGN